MPKLEKRKMITHDMKRKCEALWPIFRISHPRSHYIYDLLYRRRKDISKDLYEFFLDEGYADCNMITKWKKELQESRGSRLHCNIFVYDFLPKPEIICHLNFNPLEKIRVFIDNICSTDVDKFDYRGKQCFISSYYNNSCWCDLGEGVGRQMKDREDQRFFFAGGIDYGTVWMAAKLQPRQRHGSLSRENEMRGRSGRSSNRSEGKEGGGEGPARPRARLEAAALVVVGGGSGASASSGALA